LIVAAREYSAAVKTKSFIVSLILLPIMMGGGVIAQRLGQKLGDTTTKSVAIIDRSGGPQLSEAIDKAVARRNTKEVFDETGRQVRAKFTVEKVEPADLNDAVAVEKQRVELSDRVRSGELLAFAEIGPDVLKPPSSSSKPGDPDRATINYSTNRPTYREFYALLQSAVRPVVVKSRLAITERSDDELRRAEPTVADRGLATRDADGKVSYESKSGQIAPFLVPMVLLLLMFIVVIVGASPMTANVIEEKQLRIAEVLLGSARPFEIMMGKLLGGVGVALTLAAIYFGGAYYVAVKQGVASHVSGASMIWFLFFTVVGTLMYGSMFVAAGAAVTNVKEAQTMIMPVMFLIMLPLFAIGNMIQDPSGLIAMVASFFPFSAPMVMTARISIPPGVPVWQAILAAVVTLLTTVVLVWSAGRIFRVGILMQGQGAKVGEMLRWVVRG
jgi:ABC-type Na+ efflux pump permease subunit